MFKKLLNEAIFEYTFETYSPLLIQGKENGCISPMAVDISYIKTYKDGNLVPYIPGSSLKGVFRSYSESILEGACDIVGKNRKYIEDGREKECLSKDNKQYKSMSGAERYEKSCLVCKLFGSDTIKSRVSFSNAYPVQPCKIETAGMTAIDRVKGGAKSGALRDVEYVGYGIFKGKITLKNYAPYQLKLIARDLEALEMGEIRLGSYTSKGFGELGVKSLKLTLRNYTSLEKKQLGNDFYSEKTIEGMEEVVNSLKDITFKDVKIDG